MGLEEENGCEKTKQTLESRYSALKDSSSNITDHTAINLLACMFIK